MSLRLDTQSLFFSMSTVMSGPRYLDNDCFVLKVLKTGCMGTSLVDQELGLCASTAGGMDLTPGWGIPQAA